MFEFPCIISLYNIKSQQDATLAVLFLVNARSLYMFQTLSASIIRSTKNCSSSHWCMSWVGMMYIQQGRPRSVAYCTVIAYLGLNRLCHSLFRTK